MNRKKRRLRRLYAARQRYFSFKKRFEAGERVDGREFSFLLRQKEKAERELTKQKAEASA